jgi:hypothetical protein
MADSPRPVKKKVGRLGFDIGSAQVRSAEKQRSDHDNAVLQPKAGNLYPGNRQESGVPQVREKPLRQNVGSAS